MARGSASSSSSSSSSSRKVCPPNKFSIMTGCMSWATALALIALGALIVICILIMSNNKNIPYTIKKGDIIEESRRRKSNNNNNASLTINGQKAIDFERVRDSIEPIDPMSSPNDGTGTPPDNRIRYDINVNMREMNPERPNINILSYDQYNAEKSMERIINPILPPERSYQNTYGIPINIPSRGPNLTYQQTGILYKENIENPDQQSGNNTDSNILPLFGRPTFNGSNKWNYYTSSDKFQNVKLPITIAGRKCDSDLGCDELRDGDMISVPSYNGRFRVEIYRYDQPRYIPYVY